MSSILADYLEIYVHLKEVAKYWEALASLEFQIQYDIQYLDN